MSHAQLRPIIHLTAPKSCVKPPRRENPSPTANMGAAQPKAAGGRLTPSDALALGEDGDLLLAREALAHAALRLRLDAAVARDVGRAQRGQLPDRLATRLPGAWRYV